jgi:hypothetical protein
LGGVGGIVFDATFNNISVISWLRFHMSVHLKTSYIKSGSHNMYLKAMVSNNNLTQHD